MVRTYFVNVGEWLRKLNLSIRETQNAVHVYTPQSLSLRQLIGFLDCSFGKAINPASKRTMN